MKRFLTLVLVALLLQPSAAASGRGPCTAERLEVHHSMSTTRQHATVRRLIHCAVSRWSVPGGASKAISVATCESSLYAWAHNGDNLGLFQISGWDPRARYWLRRAWFPRWSHAWMPDAFRARANTLVAIRWAHHSGWAAWACA